MRTNGESNELTAMCKARYTTLTVINTGTCTTSQKRLSCSLENTTAQIRKFSRILSHQVANRWQLKGNSCCQIYKPPGITEAGDNERMICQSGDQYVPGQRSTW